MDRVVLYEEYRLIERNDSEVHTAWKGGHLLLFFLAFVFGSFCSFCFHMLINMFDNKCVLFPTIVLTSTMSFNRRQELRRAVETNPTRTGDEYFNVQMEYLSTKWAEEAECWLPLYTPLLSAIAGLVWTTMFLMCTAGGKRQQRPWRVLPFVFLFSLAMGAFCSYYSYITHNGLNDLCLKLSKVIGSDSCTYSVNIAALAYAYDMRPRGVYQAIQMTLLSTWLHSICWLMSAVLTVVRMLLHVDFKVVRLSAQLQANVDTMLERFEKSLVTVLPDSTPQRSTTTDAQIQDSDAIVVLKKEPSLIMLQDVPVQSTGPSEVTSSTSSRKIRKDFLKTVILGQLGNALENRDRLQAILTKIEKLDEPTSSAPTMESLHEKYPSTLSLTKELYEILDPKRQEIVRKEMEAHLKQSCKPIIKSNLKNAEVQTSTDIKDKRKVHIAEDANIEETIESEKNADDEEYETLEKETQTKKTKQD